MHYFILPRSIALHDESRAMKCFILFKRMGTVIYHSVIDFASGSVNKTSDKPRLSEKLVVSAFVLFTFFVLVAYSGSTAASFVNNKPGPE